jgi:hypothetical protein
MRKNPPLPVLPEAKARTPSQYQTSPGHRIPLGSLASVSTQDVGSFPADKFCMLPSKIE